MNNDDVKTELLRLLRIPRGSVWESRRKPDTARVHVARVHNGLVSVKVPLLSCRVLTRFDTYEFLCNFRRVVDR